MDHDVIARIAYETISAYQWVRHGEERTDWVKAPEVVKTAYIEGVERVATQSSKPLGMTPGVETIFRSLVKELLRERVG